VPEPFFVAATRGKRRLTVVSSFAGTLPYGSAADDD
jgi:hypothetical protein